ncbi:MAG: hypothetical protein Q9217_005255 [Psora testacea]
MSLYLLTFIPWAKASKRSEEASLRFRAEREGAYVQDLCDQTNQRLRRQDSGVALEFSPQLKAWHLSSSPSTVNKVSKVRKPGVKLAETPIHNIIGPEWRWTIKRSRKASSSNRVRPAERCPHKVHLYHSPEGAMTDQLWGLPMAIRVARDLGQRIRLSYKHIEAVCLHVVYQDATGYSEPTDRKAYKSPNDRNPIKASRRSTQANASSKAKRHGSEPLHPLNGDYDKDKSTTPRDSEDLSLVIPCGNHQFHEQPPLQWGGLPPTPIRSSTRVLLEYRGERRNKLKSTEYETIFCEYHTLPCTLSTTASSVVGGGADDYGVIHILSDIACRRKKPRNHNAAKLSLHELTLEDCLESREWMDHFASAKHKLRVLPPREPSNETKIIFDSPLTSALLDTADEPDRIGVEGSMRYLQDLGVQLDEPALLTILTELGAPTIGEFSRTNFVEGWIRMRADTLPKQQAHIPSLRRYLLTNPDVFKKTYKQTFLLARQSGQKVLPLLVAIEYWRTLLSPPSLSWSTPTTPWLEWWFEYLENGWKKSVSKDMWDQTGLFVMKSLGDETMAWWSEEGSWPGVIDDFVAFVKNKRAAGEVMDGGDDTFSTFPNDLLALVNHALLNVTVQAVTYPKFETRGDLKELQNKVIDLEVAASTPSPTIDPSVHTILIGHSMGGIVAAETLLAIASESPIPYHPAHNATSGYGVDPLPSTAAHTQPSTSNTGLSSEIEPSSFMFPHIAGVLAFDTPYLGISPGVIAHGAETHYKTASTAYSALSEVAGVFGYHSSKSPNPPSQQQQDPSKLLTQGADAMTASMTASTQDAAATPTWQRWGKYAMFAGAAGAVAAGGAAAYFKRDRITEGWSWMGSHLEFVGCLAKGEELKTRLERVITLSKERSIGFADLVTVLGKSASPQKEPMKLAGGFVEVSAAEGRVGPQRTFCTIPKSGRNKAYFEPARNDISRDETEAHMTMFDRRANSGYFALAERAKTLLVAWVEDGDWYQNSEPSNGGKRGSTGGLGLIDVDLGDEDTKEWAGEEPVFVEWRKRLYVAGPLQVYEKETDAYKSLMREQHAKGSRPGRSLSQFAGADDWKYGLGDSDGKRENSPESRISITDLRKVSSSSPEVCVLTWATAADILYTIFPYLSAFDYLNLTTCTRSFFSYRQDPTYWHALTRQTFRIPDQPLLQGHRWQWLYKKLLTQTRLYTWGDNKSGNLGHSSEFRGNGHQQLQRAPRYSGWPRQPAMDIDVGIISDVQCGGWSTTLLNSIGQIYIFGIFDGLGFRLRGSSQLRLLGFPPGYPPTTKDRYEPSTAIKQYCHGRSSVLGLSDDGKVWSWTNDTAVLVRSVHVDLRENKVLEVQTGWNRSSMYVQDVGIVYWSSDSDSDLLQGGRQEALEVADAILIDTVTIPGTGYRQKHDNQSMKDSLSARIGKVTHYVVLEAHIVFTTDLNKIFSYATTFPMSTIPSPEPLELTSFYDFQPGQPFQIRDIQGSFCNFAVFTTSGVILTASRNLLDTFDRRAAESAEEVSPDPLPQPVALPSLQSGTVISLAFGDHHLHALHTDGTITSLGTQCQQCGAFGLGSVGISAFRGVRPTRRAWGDGLIPKDNPKRRTVWFEPLMEQWLEHMVDMVEKSRVPGSGEAQARALLMTSHNPDAIEAMGDYFEKEGRKWEDGVTEEGEMGGYFVLKVAAAGWHSAALVLVDDKKVEQARENHTHRLNPPEPEHDHVQASFQGEKKSGPPSLASNETIDSPSEQLANAVTAACSWLWNLGRRFLGLSRRDELRNEASRTEGGPADDQNNPAVTAEAGQKVVGYTWDQDELPRLRMRNGQAMPGTVEVVELEE